MPVAGYSTRFTRADLELLPEDWRAELHEGELVMVPAPDPYHQHVALALYERLARALGAEERYRVLVAPVDVVVDDETVLQPDLLVLPAGASRPTLPWRIPHPLWVAEVLSPKSAKRDRGIKHRLYARAGVREAWLVDPDSRTIEVCDLVAGGREKFEGCGDAGSRALPGLRVEVAELFPG